MKTHNNNNVQLIGKLGTKPTVKIVSGGRRMARFAVASLEPDEKTGRQKVKWYAVISWGKVADMAERCLKKGKRVMICGHLVTNSWVDKKGLERTKKEILATNIILMHQPKTETLSNAA